MARKKLTRNQRKKIKQIASTRGKSEADKYKARLKKKLANTPKTTTTSSRLGTKQRKKYNKIKKNQGAEKAREYRLGILGTPEAPREDTTTTDFTPAPESLTNEPTETVTAPSTESLDEYQEEIRKTIYPDADETGSTYKGDIIKEFKSIDDLASTYLNNNSEFFNRRITKETKDLDKVLASRGLYNSGAALEQNRELINDVRAEETERAYDLASLDMQAYNQNLLGNQGNQTQTRLSNSGTARDLAMYETDRNDKLNQQDVDNLLRTTELMFRQSPLQQGFTATQNTAQNTYNTGNTLAGKQEQNYTRVTPNLKSAPSYVAPPPTLNRTSSTLADARARGEQAINQGNIQANSQGNRAVSGGGGFSVQDIGSIINAGKEIFNMF